MLLRVCSVIYLGSLSTRVFETRTATGSELFSLLTCFHTTTFTLLSIFSPLQMISIKIWETPLSCHVKCSLPVSVRVSKTRVLKLANRSQKTCGNRNVVIGSLSNDNGDGNENVISKYKFMLLQSFPDYFNLF